MAWVTIANLKGAPGDAAALGRFQDIEDALAAHEAELTRLNNVKAEQSALEDVDRAKPDFTDPHVVQDVPQNATEPYLHALADRSGRIGLGVRRENGEVYMPGGTESPTTGMRVHEGFKYSFVFADSNGRVSEMRLGRDGLVPSDVLEAWGDRAGWSSGSGGAGASRSAGVALTLADSTTPTTTMNNNTVRLPIILGATASEWRVHIRNYNDKNNTAYSGALNFNGIFIGEHERGADGRLSGHFSATPAQVAGGFSTPANGGEWVSAWVTDRPLKAQTDYLLSYGYTCENQPNYLAAAGCWTSENATQASELTPTLTESKWAPFDVWLEVKVAGSTPVIMYLGDSLLVGIQASLPVYDSWAARHAVANGAIHSVYAIGGSQATDWLSLANRRLNKWSSLSSPDAAITALGNNDLYSYSVSSAEMQDRTVSVMRMLRENFCDAVYLTTILPRIGAQQGLKDTASNFNNWLLQIPAGAREAFDFHERIADSSGDADPKWSSTTTNFHLSTAGYARCATTITHRLA